MSKQTTLFQTWGYEGNIPSQNNSQVKQSQQKTSSNNGPPPARNTKNQNPDGNIENDPFVDGNDEFDNIDGMEEDAFSDDDAEFTAALEQSLQDYEDTMDSGTPSHRNVTNITGASLQSPSTSYVHRTPGVQNVQRTPGVQSTSNIFRTPNVQRTPGQNTSYGFQTPSNQRSHQVTQYSSQAPEVIPGFDLSAGATWIYPTNKSFRQYQFDIVKSCLFDNTLVCLPTGLGKTFIAAVVMYNFYRWYPQGKIVFMAPTKPLVAQQIEACFYTMGIPQSDCMEMTGSVNVGIRKNGWQTKRVFFLTPQVMSNDLARGLFPAREVKLLVVDEAHKAQGEYAYCQVARELFRSEAQTRILALSATPGNDLPAVKAVLQNLFISHIELRHEESPDVLPYTNERQVQKIVVGLGAELQEFKTKLLSVIEVYTKRLCNNKALRQGPNPNIYSKFSILKSRDEWRQNPPGGVTPAQRGIVEADFAVAMSLYHGYDLLTQHGMRPFFNFFTKKDEGDMSGKRINQSLGRIPAWRDMLDKLTEKFKADCQHSMLNQSRIHLTQQDGNSMNKKEEAQDKIVVSHPKIEKLIEVVQQHFQDFKDKGQDTRVMIFSQYRDSVHEVVGCLADYSPTIKPMAFIGQAGSVGKKGLSQKEQIEVISRFRSGGYNTLVATCVGEEGLDIGEVDLIVLFDVSKSPIRLVQRMGRTGRKRAGRIVVLVTEGLEERKYNQSLISKKTINKALLERNKLVHALYPNCPRMVPRGVTPECLQMKMITEEFKAPSHSAYNRKSIGEQQGGTKLKGRKSGNKYDVFRQNCGFLTDTDQERWREVFGEDQPSDRPVCKRLLDPEEYWDKEYTVLVKSTQDEDLVPRIDLSDYALWNKEPASRKLVGEGDLTRVYLKIRELASDSLKLNQMAEDIESKVKETDETRNQELPEPRTAKSTNKKQARPKKTISTFFKPSSQLDEPSVGPLGPVRLGAGGTQQDKADKITGEQESDIDINEILASPTSVMDVVEDIPVTDEPMLDKNDDDIEIIEIIENKNAEEPVVDQYKDLIDDLLDESDNDSGIGFSSLELPNAFDVDSVLENKHKYKTTPETIDKWFELKDKYKNMFLSELHENFIQVENPEVYPLLISNNKTESKQGPSKGNEKSNNAKSQQKMTNDAKSQHKMTNDAKSQHKMTNDAKILHKRSDEARKENLFEINSPLLESIEIDTEPEQAANYMSDGFDIGSPDIDDIMMSQDIFASPVKQGRNSPFLNNSPVRSNQEEEIEDLGSSPIVSRSQSVQKKKRVSRLCLEESQMLASSTPMTDKSRRSSLLTSSNLTPIREAKNTTNELEEQTSPILKRSQPKVLAMSKKDRRSIQPAASRRKVLNESDKFKDILAEYTPPRLTDRLAATGESRGLVVPDRVDSPDLFANDSFDEEEFPSPDKLPTSSNKPSKFKEKELFPVDETNDQAGDKDNIINISGFDDSLQIHTNSNRHSKLTEHQDFQQESINQFPEESESFRFSTSNLLGATALVGILHDTQLSESHKLSPSSLRQSKQMAPPASRQNGGTTDNQLPIGTQRSTKTVKRPTQMSSYPELSDNFGSFGGQLSSAKGNNSNKQKEASKSNKELDSTPEPNFDLLGSEDVLEVDDNNSQGSVKGQVHESQSLFGGNESEIIVSGGKKRSLISQEAEKENGSQSVIGQQDRSKAVISQQDRSQAVIGQQDVYSPPILSYVELRNDICSSIAPTATPLANFDLEMSEDMFAQDDDGEDSFMENQVLTQKEAPKAKSPSPEKESSKTVNNSNNQSKIEKNSCPICGEMIAGAEGGIEINAHIDACLSKDIINEFSQQSFNPGPSVTKIDPKKDTFNSPLLPARIDQMKKRKLVEESGFITPSDKKRRTVSPDLNNRARSPDVLDETGLSNVINKTPERQQRIETTSEEEGDSPIVRRRGTRARILATQAPESNPRQDTSSSRDEDLEESPDISKVPRRRTLESSHLDSSDDDCFLKPAASVRAQKFSKISSKKKTETESEDDSFIQPNRVSKKQDKGKGRKGGAGAQFLDYEAQLSGSDEGSDAHSDEESGEQEKYDESFVDDASQTVDTAMYLRSVKSPQFKRPGLLQRKLAPITDDIYSQAPEPDDESYEEDSFCVDSDEIEYQSEPDTLDILEAAASKKSRRNKNNQVSEKKVEKTRKRRRVVMADDDTSHDESMHRDILRNQIDQSIHSTDNRNKSRTALCTPPVALGPATSKRILQTPPVAALPGTSRVANRNTDDYYCVRPDVSNSASKIKEYPSMIIASTEINKIPTIISNLKHIHKVNVIMRQTNIPFIISTRMCAIRISEADFNLGTYRKQLEERICDCRDLFDKIAFIVEKDKEKLGGAGGSGKPPSKIHLLTLAQLAASTKLNVLYSIGKEHTGTLLADLVYRENKKGLGLPRGRLSLSQEDMVKFLQNVPGVGLSLAMKLSTCFPKLRSIFLATPKALVEKTGMTEQRATQICSFFSQDISTHDREILPL